MQVIGFVITLHTCRFMMYRLFVRLIVLYQMITHFLHACAYHILRFPSLADYISITFSVISMSRLSSELVDTFCLHFSVMAWRCRAAAIFRHWYRDSLQVRYAVCIFRSSRPYAVQIYLHSIYRRSLLIFRAMSPLLHAAWYHILSPRRYYADTILWYGMVARGFSSFFSL